MHHRTLWLGALLSFPVLHSTPAAAEPAVSADQARQVQQQIEAWLAGIAGTPSPAGQHGIQVTPEDDHYRLTIPLQSLSDGPAPLQFTLAARPLEAPRWAFEGAGFKLPADYAITQTLPATAAAPARTVKIHYTITAKEQTGIGLWDPTFKTASTFSQSATQLRSEATGETLHQVMEAALSHGTTVIQPVDADRVDVNLEGTLEGLSLETQMEAGEFKVAIKMGRVAGAITGLERERAAAMVASVAKVSAASQGLSPDAKSALTGRTVLEGLRGLADGLTLDETFDGISVIAGGTEYGASKGMLGLTVQNVKGLADIAMVLAVEGVAPGKPGPFDTFIPGAVTLKPHVTGLTSKEWLDFVIASSAPNADRQGLANALLSKGELEAGLEPFEIVLGRTGLTGTVTVHFNPGGAPRIAAEISATHFEDLSAKASATPFAAQAIPALLLVKGMARTSGDRLLWSVLSETGRTTVNGTDLSAALGQRR